MTIIDEIWLALQWAVVGYLHAWASEPLTPGRFTALVLLTLMGAMVVLTVVYEVLLAMMAVLMWLVNCTVLAVLIRLLPPHALLAVAQSAARMAHRMVPTLLPEQLSARAQWYAVAAQVLLPKGYTQTMTYRAEVPVLTERPHWSERTGPNGQYMLYLWIEAANELARLRGRTMTPLMKMA